MRLSGSSGPQARSSLAFRLGRRAATTWAELVPGRALPAAVRAGLGLEPRERVLCAEGDRDGECVLVATDRAVYHRVPASGCARPGLAGAGGGFAGAGGGTPDPGGGTPGGNGELAARGAGGWARLGWEYVAQVGWDAAAGQLIVIGVSCQAGDAASGTVGAGQAGAVPPRVMVPLRQRGTVPELAAERVAHTRLGQWQLHVAGRRRAVIEARRRPGTGELLWSVTPDAGGHGHGHGHGEPDIGAHAARAIARLSAEFGALPQPETGLPALRSAALPATSPPIVPPQAGGKAATAE